MLWAPVPRIHEAKNDRIRIHLRPPPTRILPASSSFVRRYDEISPSNCFSSPTTPDHTSCKLTRRQNKSKVAYPSADITMENRGTPQQDRWTNRWCQRSDLGQRRCDVADDARTVVSEENSWCVVLIPETYVEVRKTSAIARE